MRPNEYVITFHDIHCVAHTDRAILCVIDGREYWIPLSNVHEDSEVFEKDTFGDLIISEWIAHQKGLI